MSLSKTIYLTLSAVLILSLPFLANGLDWSVAWFLPMAALAAAALLALAAFSLRGAILLIIFIMPAVTHFNYLKINIFSYLPFLNNYSFLFNPASLIYLLIILFGAITIFEKRRDLKNLPLKYILLAASAYAAASIFRSADRQTSLIELIYLLVPFSLYLIAYLYFSGEAWLTKLMLAAVFSSIIPLIAAAAQLLAGDYFYEPSSSLGRLTGGLDHPNTFGLFLFLIIALTLTGYLAKKKQKIKDNKFLLFLLAGSLFFLALSYSRTAWVALAVFSALLIFIKRKAILLLLAALPAGAAAFLLSSNIRSRVLETFDSALFSSVTARINIWRVALSQIQLKPLTGHGVGQAEAVIEKAKTWRGGISLPHNDYLLQTLELGLIGLAIFLAYTLGVIYYAYKTFAALPNEPAAIRLYGRDFSLNFKIIAFGLLAVLLALLPATIFESTSQKIILQIIIWPLLGSLFSLKKLQAA
ncbi:MAG: O-antigen ligase family protein [bacterium]|nr:O-antigen ligase family protein [bacterium]